jgi:hypothetical protein
MVSTARGVTTLAAVLAATMALATPSGAAPSDPVLPPPSADAFVSTTNAMMRPGDVPASLLPEGAWSVGYQSPPGGQDPFPVCVYGRNAAVTLPLANAIAYQSGANGFSQIVYDYSSAAKAQAAWAKVSRQVSAKCTGQYTLDDSTTTLTSGRLPAAAGSPAGWWIRSNSSGRDAYGTYLAVRPVGDAIQMVYLYDNEGNATKAQESSINALSRTLAVRLAAAAALPLTQDALLTTAQRAMITPADVPASLPYTLPADGGWSTFQSYEPGSGPWVCGAGNLPKGTASFESGFGGQGGITAEPGAWDQRVEVYATVDAARKAWRKLAAAVLDCTAGGSGPLSQTKQESRQASGTSALTFQGTPGVWSRELDTYPETGTCTNDAGKSVACEGFTAKNYMISLLVGNAIQTVTYYTSVDGITDMPLDQAAVNAVAEQLAQRWAATSAG